jgi:hypothetical protein
MTDQTDRESLAAQLDLHVLEESAILQEFRTLSDTLQPGPLRVLVDHIVTEEEMHHFLMSTLCDWLRAPDHTAESLAAQDVDRDAVRRQTEVLVGHERKTVEACRDLARRFDGADSDLFTALLEAIALDSEKHQLLLATVAKLVR